MVMPLKLNLLKPSRHRVPSPNMRPQIRNNSKLLDNFTYKLNSEFATMDLGSLGYFLGLEITSTTDGLLHLSADGPPFLDPTLYRSFVGALQYLTITRLDIAYAISSVNQFLYFPSEDHFLTAKHILHYIKGTLHFGLTFHPSVSPSALVAYSNVDWAGCVDTRRSTFGYCIYLGDNLVSCSATK
ncbi:uncharacterized mitochondrial protein AtMg00810-like [Malania oleifera]|uniref:uncharacterized mitochondrial protein AtMg00810-like n=1 Tax=Malania oleifera TaxID=397392 RepID=UPI0025ADB638|nr:uncharacterized mitochondrial protein AtMg00810-like [Malania oleifera]